MAISDAENAADVLVFEGPRGSNQTAVRAYNERLVLSLVRRHGSLAKVDIARETGLSAQTVSVIMRSLEGDGLLVRGEPKKGRVGQPSVPMSLKPGGAYSIGLKIGRRSADLLLMDFVGNIHKQLHETYAYPSPSGILEFVETGVKVLAGELKPGELERVAGLGIAAPFELWNWADEAGASQAETDAWRGFDLQREVAKLVAFPVFMENDATSACGAELVFGLGSQYPDFLYFFVGSFIGGGVVINSSLFKGRTGTAGALGSIPIPDGHGGSQQLIEAASVHVLERKLTKAGIDPRPLWYSADDWVDFGEPLAEWIESTAEALAYAIVSSAAVIDFGAAIIDGGFPTWVRKRIVQATRNAMGDMDQRGVIIPEILEGQVGSNARAIGGASLPLFSRYLLDFNSFLKETA
jgi:predicted NBD/HSP70 family sugar kinase